MGINKIVVADGGSTKCKWAVATVGGSGTGVDVFETKGVNPLQLSAEAIVGLWRDEPIAATRGVDIIIYYGAGCIGGAPNERIAEALRSLTGCGNVEVLSDMLGAARALFGSKRGIACILGTGCNSCLYDGRGIVRSVRPLGYILGDEGSGADIGKHIVADALKGLLPDDLAGRFYEFAGADYATIIERIYSQPRANAYLASFARFAADNMRDPHVRGIVRSRFEAFIRRNVSLYLRDGVNVGRVGFVGGVASQFADILRQVCEAAGLPDVDVVADPLRPMVEYHLGGVGA